LKLPPLAASDLDEVLDHTRELWDGLAGERVFVTGGTGFFGVWLLESFAWANRRLDLGARAVVLSRRPEAFAARLPHLAHAPELTFHVGDASSFTFPEGSFAAVIHAATESYAAADDRLDLYERDVTATRRTLDFALQARAARVLFTSSGAVYGKQPPQLSHVPENYAGAPEPTDTRSGYGQAKRASELLCALYAEQRALHTTIARCFAFVGPHLPLDAAFAIGNFMGDALSGRPIRVAGDGTPFRSYMYMTDLACWLWTILLRGEAARPYNVGSDQALDIAELARRVARAVAPELPVEIAGTPVPGAPAARYVPDITRARSELGLEARVGLADAIARTTAWHRAAT